MTPDELPADMEAVVSRLSDPHLDLGFDDDGDLAGHLVDREDLRALLKAYQEQRRALARSQSLLRECLGDYGHRNFTDRYGMADRIRSALNQKGDER
jgi:hypothetical protein